MTIQLSNGKPVSIKADEGKVLRRKDTYDIYGDEVFLGYSYYINGEKLDEPHLDVPADFEEIFDITEENGEN